MLLLTVITDKVARMTNQLEIGQKVIFKTECGLKCGTIVDTVGWNRIFNQEDLLYSVCEDGTEPRDGVYYRSASALITGNV
jgi:hypothetical protein